MRKRMFYTDAQWQKAEEILEGCFKDYMVYADSVGTQSEESSKETDLLSHLEAKLDIIQHGMMGYEYFTVMFGDNFQGYSNMFKAAFSHWLDNKYLHHLSLTGYQRVARMEEDEREELNRKGSLLLEITQSIAGTLNKDGSVPTDKYSYH